MASFKVLVFLATVSIFATSISAVEHVVGDDKGWTINFDYQAWAQGKEFRVGDKLVFIYPQGSHNVLRVDDNGFSQCAAPAGTEALTTGSDVITLSSPGKKWYICGVGQHCEVGKQKLSITVLAGNELGSPAAAPPSPTSAAWGTTVSTFCVLVAVVAIFGMIIV